MDEKSVLIEEFDPEKPGGYEFARRCLLYVLAKLRSVCKRYPSAYTLRTFGPKKIMYEVGLREDHLTCACCVASNFGDEPDVYGQPIRGVIKFFQGILRRLRETFRGRKPVLGF